jgi:hypothetical protein
MTIEKSKFTIKWLADRLAHHIIDWPSTHQAPSAEPAARTAEGAGAGAAAKAVRAEEWKPENWFIWPPDVFALTSIFLKATGIYRYTVTPHPNPKNKKNKRLFKRHKEKKEAAILQAWYAWLIGKSDQFPDDLREYVEVLFEEKPGETFGGQVFNGVEYDRDYCDKVLRLHALADAACPGFGILSVSPEGPVSALYFLANYLLNVKGTLSRLPKYCGVVLPKMRTPQRGLTLRSFSHHLTFHDSEVDVLWRTVPWDDRMEKTVNILAVPLPYHISSHSFRPYRYPGQNKDVSGVRYFEYAPQGKEGRLDVQEIIKLLDEAYKEVEHVHFIVFPELALTKEQFKELRKEMAQELSGRTPPRQVPIVIAGIRDTQTNKVQLSVFFVNKWYNFGQAKHHKWKLNRRQLKQYALGGSLNVQYNWWEAINIEKRELTFVSPTGWLTLCPLICEDLAQLEPVSDLIRGVGPTLVIAILMDGPQLAFRWPARYVSVLADDPGTSVLTLTSVGMSVRARAQGKPPNRTVALWKDLDSDFEQIELAEGERGLLLTISADPHLEYTADGRSDHGSSAVFSLQGTHHLRVAQATEADAKAEGNNKVKAQGDTAGAAADRATTEGVAEPGDSYGQAPLEDPSLTSTDDSSRNDDSEFESDEFGIDITDLSALAYLTAAIIDAPGNLIAEFRDQVSRKSQLNPLVAAMRPFQEIWPRIREARREGQDLQKERLKISNWSQEDQEKQVRQFDEKIRLFEETVDELCGFMKEMNQSLNDQMDFAKMCEEEEQRKRLKKEDKVQWKTKEKARIEDQLKRWDKIVRGAMAALKGKQSGPFASEKDRVAIMPYVCVIWAVQNRLWRHRRQVEWRGMGSYRKLRQLIEDWQKETSYY